MKKHQRLIILCIIGIVAVAFLILPELIRSAKTCPIINTIKTETDDTYSMIRIEKDALFKGEGTNDKSCNQLQILIPVLIKGDRITFVDHSLEAFNQTSVSDKNHETQIAFTHEIIHGNKLIYYVNYVLKEGDKRVPYEIEETLVYKPSDHAFHFEKSDK